MSHFFVKRQLNDLRKTTSKKQLQGVYGWIYLINAAYFLAVLRPKISVVFIANRGSFYII